MYKVVFYDDERGESDVENFLIDLKKRVIKLHLERQKKPNEKYMITEGGMDTNEELARTQKRTRLHGGR